MKEQSKILFLDVKNKEDFYNINRNLYYDVKSEFIFSSQSKLNRLLRKVCLKFNLGLIKNILGNWKNELKQYEIVIVTDSIYNNLISKYVRENFQGRVIVWYWNPVVGAFNPNNIETKGCELWSFDKNDCKTYGMKYNTTYYFKTIKLPNENIINDIYFIGADKGRLEELIKLEETFKKSGLKTDFHITKSKSSNNKEYKFRDSIDYDQVLSGIAKSKVILDYVQQGQSGLTQRPMEAIFHSKKLITNDKNIIEYDFYNKNNIFVLGHDDINNIYEFVNSPYIPIDEKIIDKYDFRNWCRCIKGGI